MLNVASVATLTLLVGLHATVGCTPRTPQRPSGLFDKDHPTDPHRDQRGADPPEVTRAYRDAMDAASKGRPEGEAKLRQFLQTHPQALNSGRASAALARLLIRRGEAKEALAVVEPYLETARGASRIEALVAAASASLHHGNPERCAETALEAATLLADSGSWRSDLDGLTPGSARLLEGECRMLMGQHAAALKAYSMAYPSLGLEEERHYARKRMEHLVFQQLSPAEASALRGRLKVEPAETYLLARHSIQTAARGDIKSGAQELANVREWFIQAGESDLLETLNAQLKRHQVLTRQDSPPVVGLMLPLDGPNRRIGWKVLWGALLAVGTLDEPQLGQLGLVIRDSGSHPNQARAIVDELAANPLILGVVGPTDVRAAQAAAEKAQEHGLPMVALTVDPGLPSRGDMVFRNFVDMPREARAVAAYLERTVPWGETPRVAILAPDIPYGRMMADLFTQEATAKGAIIALDARYDADSFDFAAVLTSLQGAGTVHAIFIPDIPRRVATLATHLAAKRFWSLPAGEPAPKMARGQAQLKPVQLLGTSAWYDQDLIRRAGRYLNGAVIPVGFFAEDFSPQVVDFVSRAMVVQDGPPDYLQAFVYDTLSMVSFLFEEAGHGNRRGLHYGLKHLTQWGGVTGTTGFDTTGNPRGNLSLIMIDESGFNPVPMDDLEEDPSATYDM